MIVIDIPGSQKLELEHLVLDYNGTIASDGVLISGVAQSILDLSQNLSVHVLTADTFGGAKKELQDIPCKMMVIPKENQAKAKADYVRGLGANHCACAGNGRNDALMLKDAALGIAVIQTEGAAMEAIIAADVVTQNILDALDLMRRPLRLAATLRR